MKMKTSESKGLASLLPKDHYQSAFRFSNMALSLLDAELTILDVNEQQCRLIGRTRKECLGVRFSDLFSPVAADRIVELRQALRQSNPVTLEAGIAAKDGLEIVVSISAKQIDTAKGKRILASIHTLKREQSAVTLRESQRQLASILGSAMDAIITVDSDQRVILFNAAAEKMFGCLADVAIGQSLEHFIPERFRATHLKHIRTFGETNTTSRSMGSLGSISGLRADGVEFPIEASISQALVGGKKLFTVIIRDVTSRKQAENELKRQARLLDQATDAILVRDLEERILFWSKGAEQIYGWTAEEAVGKHVKDLHYREIAEDFYAAKQVLLERGSWSGESRHVTKDGKNLVIENRWTLLRDEKGNPESVLVIHTDITEKKRLEAQFLRAQRMESLGTLAGGIAHDINNILSPILMSIRILQMRFPDEDSQRVLGMLQASAERGGNMVRQILEFARGVEGERILLQPAHLIREILKAISDTLPRAIEVESLIAEQPLPIRADPTQFHQVLMNLIINARDAMPNGGKIRIEASNVQIDENYARMNLDASPGRYVLVAITDTGAGISSEIIDNIFDPFFTTKEPGKGTGLGLSTVMTIVKKHGGFITVYSEEGKGTEFRVYLPAAEDSAAKQVEQTSPDLPTGHGELVLVVDDESTVREITKSTLESYGYRALTAADGTEAVALFAQYKDEVKVLLTDVMMPFMDGPATIRAIQRIDPNIRIIVSSGLKTNADLIESTSAGVKVFLSKPYTADKLLNALAEVLSGE